MKVPKPKDRVSVPLRPSIRRDKFVPPPQQLPPAPPPPQEAEMPSSLSLMQLRRIVNEMPRIEPTPYAFKYEDTASFPEEIEEWFSYSIEEQAMMLKAKASFLAEWATYKGADIEEYQRGDIDWTKSNSESRAHFIDQCLVGIQHLDSSARLRNLESLVYIALGCWYETAGEAAQDQPSSSSNGQESESQVPNGKSTFTNSALQLEWIRRNIATIHDHNGVKPIYAVLQSICARECSPEMVDKEISVEENEANRREVWCILTLTYFLLEVGRTSDNSKTRAAFRSTLLNLNPGFLLTLTGILTKLRWDESISLPQSKMILIYWKTILVYFGGLDFVNKAKASFREDEIEQDKVGHPLITASPLDYHAFRQEITSKYPAYNPPPPLFPLEPDNNSILPPLKNHPSKATGPDPFAVGLGNGQGHGASIIHQPVHIATPAPSPPPSPAGPGGKGGKKQNYQTNQMFPFLYPPLDESSNNLGGKGSTDLQDILVGRKWKGSDIPASILEAAELFAKRMRATRAMKQLWEERVRFMKYDRGWTGPTDDPTNETDGITAFCLDPFAPDNSGDNQKISNGNLKAKEETKLEYPDGSIEQRMQLVEDYYATCLPNLQSVVMVVMKSLLATVSTLVTQQHTQQSAGPNGITSAIPYGDGPNGNAANKNAINGTGPLLPDMSKATAEELDTIRNQEIAGKATSGILILLLKWFKVSHVLKFEYLTQLLLDSNYLILVLKLLQTQELERVVNYRCDREELNFFYFTRSHSRKGIEEPTLSDLDKDSDSDDAIPPPIRRNRSLPISPGSRSPLSKSPTRIPEVDELGIPTTDLPSEPITSFSWRNFFTSINYLRIMQKICKGKAHRNLLMVQYKSSQFLRKCLKVPQPLLRLYTLKLFKSQVPYCGRKWRQSNMRVITAIYLHCRPELRDDWLAGSDVDAEVDESVPLEQALRALTHWWNLRNYEDKMGEAKGVLKEEQDFFRRELEKLGWTGIPEIGQDEGQQEEAPQQQGGTEWEGAAEAWG
ncbi:N1221-domain-containing protein [Patellaria atrata CBS 101060]|uniref:N1221-domain-containing protein n=1 Tax=Patellaria atrata CBS 101060 TaxID=1346257 RepID=A0A9P4VSE8_9PEZI|nr:N1221-domain-containing protein [Patellaria atrata CBS 101060]